MTDTEINLAIAEACGWKDVHFSESWNATIGTKGEPGGETYGTIPSYASDLNAMHEAEKTLTFALSTRYNRYLRIVLDADTIESEAGNHDWHATARQRAEAFLRTLGKWV